MFSVTKGREKVAYSPMWSKMCDATATVIVIDLRHHRHDYPKFCQEIQKKLGIAQDKSLSAVNLYLL